MKRPNPVNAAGWFMLGLCVVALAAMYVLLLVTLPVVGGLLTSHVLVAVTAVLLTDRDLRAENDGLRKLHDAWNSSEKREDFADVGRVTGPTNAVELYDQDAGPDALSRSIDERWDAAVSRSGDHIGQACGWSEDGTTLCGEPAEGWARWPDGEPTWLCAVHMQWRREDAEDDEALNRWADAIHAEVEGEAPYQGPQSLPTRGERID